MQQFNFLLSTMHIGTGLASVKVGAVAAGTRPTLPSIALVENGGALRQIALRQPLYHAPLWNWITISMLCFCYKRVNSYQAGPQIGSLLSLVPLNRAFDYTSLPRKEVWPVLDLVRRENSML